MPIFSMHWSPDDEGGDLRVEADGGGAGGPGGVDGGDGGGAQEDGAESHGGGQGAHRTGQQNRGESYTLRMMQVGESGILISLFLMPTFSHYELHHTECTLA